MFKRNLKVVIVGFLIALSAVILYSFNPVIDSEIYPPSLVRKFTGFYCAGCGSLRALHQLLQGNWQAALSFNPLIVVCMPYLVYWLATYFIDIFYHIKLPTIALKNKQISAIAFIVILYTILRNIPSPPFSWLAP